MSPVLSPDSEHMLAVAFLGSHVSAPNYPPKLALVPKCQIPLVPTNPTSTNPDARNGGLQLKHCVKCGATPPAGHAAGGINAHS